MFVDGRQQRQLSSPITSGAKPARQRRRRLLGCGPLTLMCWRASGTMIFGGPDVLRVTPGRGSGCSFPSASVVKFCAAWRHWICLQLLLAICNWTRSAMPEFITYFRSHGAGTAQSAASVANFDAAMLAVEQSRPRERSSQSDPVPARPAQKLDYWG